MALSVFCLITILAGINPAIIVVTNNIPALYSVPDNGATKIPSENGKLIALAVKYGLMKKKIKIIPTIIPDSA